METESAFVGQFQGIGVNEGFERLQAVEPHHIQIKRLFYRESGSGKHTSARARYLVDGGGRMGHA
jgi:hypothetical protein